MDLARMDITDVTRRVLNQRMGRYPDAGPQLQPAGHARYRQEGARLRVAFATIKPGMAGEAVQRALRFARAQGIGVQWVVVPQRPGEAELPIALVRAGFQLFEGLLLMAHEGHILAPLNPAVVISPIVTWQAMLEYEYGSREAFFEDTYPSEQAVTQRARDRWREQEHGWCRYYVALVRGKVVGGCYVSLFEEIPTLMGVYTIAAARRQGVATALLERAIVDTIRPGHDICCLFVRHGNPAERLYHQLGFVGLCDEDTYVYETL
jgi:L-amino acid N-acyltransferase YncA